MPTPDQPVHWIDAYGRQVGPEPLDTVVQRVHAGQIPHTTLVWWEGSADGWVALHQVPDVTLPAPSTPAGAEASATATAAPATAAGTIPPAKVLVVGAGVAGLQAIATARRLGATVEAFDVRRAAKEQVESLGARFVEVDTEDAEAAGGYARALGEADRQKQAAVLLQHVARADVCITTALVPGRAAPKIVTEDMVAAMRPGSVIVDAAAEMGGNCVLTRPGQRITSGGVTIIGDVDLPSSLAVHASQMFSRNVTKLVEHLTDDSGALALGRDDEITRAVVIAHDGKLEAGLWTKEAR